MPLLICHPARLEGAPTPDPPTLHARSSTKPLALPRSHYLGRADLHCSGSSLPLSRYFQFARLRFASYQATASAVALNAKLNAALAAARPGGTTDPAPRIRRRLQPS